MYHMLQCINWQPGKVLYYLLHSHGHKNVCIFIIECEIIHRFCWKPRSSASYTQKGQAYLLCAPFCALPFQVFVKNVMHKQWAHLHVLNSHTVDVVNKEDNTIDKNIYEHTHSFYHLQLFWQGVSHTSVKVYATMPIGIMGSKSLALLDWGSRWFSNKKRERTNTCVCAVYLHRAETSWGSLKQRYRKSTITHNNFRDCRVSFSLLVRQSFSKQLYTTGSFRLLRFWQRAVLERISLQRSKRRIYGSCLFPRRR